MATTFCVLSGFARRSLRTATLLGALMLTPAGLAQAEDYTPMFSADMLAKLDPATRERFAALEDENHRRWRNRNPQRPDVAAAQRQHLETEAMLARFAESRRMEQLVKERGARSRETQEKKCATVAAEIEELSSGGTFYETADNGERRYLSDNEVSERVKSQQKSYNKHCKS